MFRRVTPSAARFKSSTVAPTRQTKSPVVAKIDDRLFKINKLEVTWSACRLAHSCTLLK